MTTAQDLIDWSSGKRELQALGLGTRAAFALSLNGIGGRSDLLAADWGAERGLRWALTVTPNCGPKTIAEIEAKRAELLGGRDAPTG